MNEFTVLRRAIRDPRPMDSDPMPDTKKMLQAKNKGERRNCETEKKVNLKHGSLNYSSILP